MQMSGALIDIQALSTIPDVTYPVQPPVETMARGGWRMCSKTTLRPGVPSPHGTGHGLVNNPEPIETVWHHEVMSLIGRNVFHGMTAVPIQYLPQMGPPVPVAAQPVIATGDVWRDSMPGLLGK